MSIVYGLINCLILLPVMMSFTSIIFHDKFFRPYQPVLVKLTLFSAAVHQLCFAKNSTLPFAVGQVQDAGLIFLSSIASNIVAYCKQRNHDDETILATTVVGLSIATFLLGIGLMVIGKLRLASLVQALPTPVVCITQKKHNIFHLSFKILTLISSSIIFFSKNYFRLEDTLHL